MYKGWATFNWNNCYEILLLLIKIMQWLKLMKFRIHILIDAH